MLTQNDLPNALEDFDQGILDVLKGYIYALRDPRDKKVFYVGKAGGKENQGNDRVQRHFEEARAAMNKPCVNQSAKVRRILDIWAADEEVEWFIVRHGLENTECLFHIEAALIDILAESQNGPALNDQNGHYAVDHGLLMPEDVLAKAAQGVDPTCSSIKDVPVFLFPIQNAVRAGANYYDATRRAWKLSSKWSNHTSRCIAVGLVGGISKCAYVFDKWNKINNSDRWEFSSIEPAPQCIQTELVNKNFRSILSRAMGYFQRGNYLIVGFDGNGNFKFERGCAQKGPYLL